MDTALKSNIAENLRKHRVLRGYTQEYIAEYLGKKDYTAYSRYEQGRSNLKMEDAIKLAELYEVDVQELISVAPSVNHSYDFSKKTNGHTYNNGQISVLVDLDGSSSNLESSISRLKKINELIARQEL
ncbi:MAG: XRE family transcriptional regulator [Mongoliibacter sp.]|jgi:transcriptional regulator with XRE-family HTH domain|uniref:helix-turn-helix domain-containing protein n=1 Tax=Mongoliibacter sp. TaxID=2022438 RepID=UPI0012F20EBD|nr:helix-turn-helix transcriptional regulator [Mongoliibacter sp.]TVP51008.1 MAG: XRE family transcriptional regulator [Mongoliibacter sp.]